jgi:hypothetical protein
MGRAAFITDPLTFGVHTYGIEPAQDAAAFGTDAHDGLTAVIAENILCPVFRMYPLGGVFGLIADITRFHRLSFLLRGHEIVLL